MPKNFYQQNSADPTQIFAWADPAIENTVGLAERLAPLSQLQALPDEARTQVAAGGIAGFTPAFPDLASFDGWLADEIERIQDLLDYPAYDLKQETIGSVFDGAWFTPEAVESVSSEEAGFEAARAIDGSNPDGWRPSAAPASITVRVRAHRKNLESIRLWIPNSTLRTELQGLSVHAAQSLSMIDDPSNLVVDNVDLAHDGTANQVVPFAFKKRARYVKLDIAGSNHAANEIEIRELAVRVVTTQHNT